MESLKRWLDACVMAYGMHGDKSLEYIGLVCGKGIPTTHKVYRLCTEQTCSGMEKQIWDTYFRAMAKQYPIQICDHSKGADAAVPSYRMVVLLKEALSLEQTVTLARTCLSYVPEDTKARFLKNIRTLCNTFHMPYAPLMQLGVEVDAQNRYIGLKYYLRLTDDIPIADTMQIIHGQGDTLKLDQLAACGYQPIFLGINDMGTAYEGKLYLISKIYGRKLCQKVHGQLNALCHTLCLDAALHDVLIYALEQWNLYPEGVAVSESGKIRLYLKEIPEKLLKLSEL